ncbi:MAG: hypothetical protein HY291_15295 [Planctomycetes bacterium]|nr:hypothetical protein [Planctomycetota bacterium]
MSTQEPPRRAASCIVLLIFFVGAFVVLGWVLRAALAAMNLAMKMLASMGGLIVLAVVFYLLYRLMSRKD